jgi:hypothetical protein
MRNVTDHLLRVSLDAEHSYDTATDGSLSDQLTSTVRKSILSFGMWMIHLIPLCPSKKTLVEDTIVTVSGLFVWKYVTKFYSLFM